MTTAAEELKTFLWDQCRWKKPLADDDDVFQRLGIDGEDGWEFMDEFSERFQVDISAYRWYFHHGSEGFDLLALFVKRPEHWVEPIAITPRDLIKAIEDRRWPITYPPHEEPVPRKPFWRRWWGKAS